MGLAPSSKLIIATNENDILHRFWQTGAYEKQSTPAVDIDTHGSGVKETLSPAMDILISSNFERLCYSLAYNVYSTEADSIEHRRKTAALKVKEWQTDLKTKGGFRVDETVLDAARVDFRSDRVSDEETLATIAELYQSTRGSDSKGYVLDPHSAISVKAALRSVQANPDVANIALSTAHPAKFSEAVELALKNERSFQFKDIFPEEFQGLEKLEKRFVRVTDVSLESVKKIILDDVKRETT
jgi:threonine synthase